jgi:hypothetical protein
MTDNTREDNTCLIGIEDFCDGECVGCQYERGPELWKGLLPKEA